MRPRRSCSAALAAGDYAAFMRLAVRSRKNILVSGPDGIRQDDLDEGPDPGDSIPTSD